MRILTPPIDLNAVDGCFKPIEPMDNESRFRQAYFFAKQGGLFQDLGVAGNQNLGVAGNTGNQFFPGRCTECPSAITIRQDRVSIFPLHSHHFAHTLEFRPLYRIYRQSQDEAVH